MDYVWDGLYNVGLTSRPSLTSIPIFPQECQRNIQESYHVDPEIIGRGSFASIRRATLKRPIHNDNDDISTKQTNNNAIFNRQYACKSISKCLCNREVLLREVYNLNRCQSTSNDDDDDDDNNNSNSNSNNNNNNHCVIRLLDVLEDRSAVHIITEICEGGELYDYVVKEHDRTGMGLRGKALCPDSRFGVYERDETRCATVIHQILVAFQHLHERARVCHRDSKASNFVFVETPSYDEGSLELRVIDFGLSAFVGNPSEDLEYRKTFDDASKDATTKASAKSEPRQSLVREITSMLDSFKSVYDSYSQNDEATTKSSEEAVLDSKGLRYMTSEVGTPYYVAPEIVRNAACHEAVGYTTQCDIWSVGVLAFLTLTGDLPVRGSDEEDTVQKLMDPDLEIDFSDAALWEQDAEETIHDPKTKPRISNDARLFCRALLQKDPTKRPSAREALGFDWITKHCGKSSLVCTRDDGKPPPPLPSLSASILPKS